MAAGDWPRAAAAAAASLVFGRLWDMWYIFSLAKWECSIPFVHRFQVFAMPLPGYAGYLPFGLASAAIGDWIEQLFKPSALKIGHHFSANISY